MAGGSVTSSQYSGPGPLNPAKFAENSQGKIICRGVVYTALRERCLGLGAPDSPFAMPVTEAQAITLTTIVQCTLLSGSLQHQHPEYSNGGSMKDCSVQDCGVRELCECSSDLGKKTASEREISCHGLSVPSTGPRCWTAPALASAGASHTRRLRPACRRYWFAGPCWAPSLGVSSCAR